MLAQWQQDKIGAQDGAQGELWLFQAGDADLGSAGAPAVPTAPKPLKGSRSKAGINSPAVAGAGGWTGHHKVPLPSKPILQ